MRSTPQRNNPLELAVRSALHGSGVRFRVHIRPAPGSRAEADIAFRGQRVVVLIDGCFWHGCPLHATRPKHNEAWWAEKLDANIERDRRTDAAFAAAGWRVLRFWEHQSVQEITTSILAVVRPSHGTNG